MICLFWVDVSSGWNVTCLVDFVCGVELVWAEDGSVTTGIEKSLSLSLARSEENESCLGVTEEGCSNVTFLYEEGETWVVFCELREERKILGRNERGTDSGRILKRFLKNGLEWFVGGSLEALVLE